MVMAVGKGLSVNVLIKEKEVDLAKQKDSMEQAKLKIQATKEALAGLKAQKAKGGKK